MTYYATRLRGGESNEKFGLAKSLSVMPGDTVKMEVFAKYLDGDNNNWNQALRDLIASIAAGGNAPEGTIVDGGAAGSIGGAAFSYASLLNRTDDNGTGPKAYLNWIIFDRDFNYKDGGFRRLSAAPLETGQNVGHEQLAYDLKVKEAGYVYIYLSNENESSVEVFFDDFKVEHVKGPVVQMEDYYPFGLTFNSYSRENSVTNNYQFNGKEEQTSLGLGWLDYGARMYMPEIGRWPKIDPKAELYFQITPYAYAANTPTNAIDPDGRLVIFINGQHSGTGGKVDYWQKREYATRYSSYSFLGQTIWSGNETRMEVIQDFASEVQDHFNDHSPARFYDGALGGWANTVESTFIPQADNFSSGDRYAMGKQQGAKDAADIINSLARTEGVITESLKIVSHSMGGAYSKGFVQAIVDYAMEHPEACRGLKISQFDFDPLQAAQLSAIAGVHTEQYSHIKKPGRKGSMGWLANGKQQGLEDDQGVKDGNSYNEDAKKADHNVMSFFGNIQNLQEGTYVYQNGQWVKQ